MSCQNIAHYHGTGQIPSLVPYIKSPKLAQAEPQSSVDAWVCRFGSVLQASDQDALGSRCRDSLQGSGVSSGCDAAQDCSMSWVPGMLRPDMTESLAYVGFRPCQVTQS